LERSLPVDDSFLFVKGKANRIGSILTKEFKKSNNSDDLLSDDLFRVAVVDNIGTLHPQSGWYQEASQREASG
jgi:hypothetical protein